jgi:hypothetical protein
MKIAHRIAAAANADWVERAAVGGSALCLVHCAGLPLLLAALPALSRLIALPESIHVWALAFALPTSAAALFLGYRVHHQRWSLVAGGIGLTLLALGALVLLGGPFETPITIIGSLCLVYAHVVNWKMRHHGHPHR